METDSPVVYHGTSESRFPPEKIKQAQIQLTAEEIRILRECNKESFYYRCLPLAALGIATTYAAVRSGHLRSHPKWGAAGKMAGAAFCGWFLGKFSYRSICEEKFLKLKNSVIGDAVRKKRGYTSESFDSEKKSAFSEESLAPYESYSPYTNNDYNSSSASLNLDVDKNKLYSGLDDRERPTTDRENQNLEEDSEPTKRLVSYEELRRRNREGFEQQPYRQAKPDASQTMPNKPWNQPESDQSRKYNSSQFEGGSRNAYGDAWDNPKFT